MTKVKFCNQCIYHRPEEGSPWLNRCVNPQVNAKDSWALSSPKISIGTGCQSEREKGFWSFPVCGMAGKQWFPK